MIRIFIILLFTNLLFSSEIEEFDNILHVRPLKIEKTRLTCYDCITTTFIVLNPISSKVHNTYDTLVAYTGLDHNINEYSTNIFDISNDYLIVYHDNYNDDSLSHYFSFSVSHQWSKAIVKNDLNSIESLVGEKDRIYLIEIRDSIIDNYFPDPTKIKGHRWNWLKYNLTGNYIDTNLFDYISLDLLEYYLDSLSQ
jgi:hypothetical protein